MAQKAKNNKPRKALLGDDQKDSDSPATTLGVPPVVPAKSKQDEEQDVISLAKNDDSPPVAVQLKNNHQQLKK